MSAPVGPPARVVIRTFGGLQLHQDDREWASSFKGRPVTPFIWLRLLVAAIGDPNARISRDELGRQANPGRDRETQLKQMRNIVYKLRELPPALGDRIRVEPQVLSFTLEGCELDAATLLTVCAESAGRSLLAPAQMVRARRAIEASGGVFLPEFESVEAIATDRHPTCTGLIRELRELLAAKRLELILLLADTYAAAERPLEAISLLEPVFKEQTKRDDLCTRLATAYNRAGRSAEAAALMVKQSPNSAVGVVSAPPT
jgi:DNA-binding SARP family transcriptional activator